MGSFVLDRLMALAPVMRVVSLPRGRHRLHVMPTTAGCEVQTSARYSWDGARRGQKPFTVLQHTISGAGWLRFEQMRYRVREGETFVVTVPHDHRYWVEDEGRWEFFWISMSGQEALRVHRNVIAAHGPLLSLSATTIDHLASCCLRIVESGDGAPGAASTLAYEALMALHDGAAGADAPSEERLGPISRAVERFRARGGGRFGVLELAAASGLTRAHFTRRFVKVMGAPPAKFMREERLRRAASALISNPQATIKQIAASAGFDDANYFAKAFRRAFAASPSVYRRQAHGR